MSDAARRLLDALAARGETLATAESLTGGLLGATITQVPGASRVYVGGVVAYATELKSRLLSVDPALIARHSVISGAVAEAMARGAVEATGAEWAIAVTGVAGPDAQDGHPPGEVWVCARSRGAGGADALVSTRQLRVAGNRDEIRTATVQTALELLLGLLPPV